MSVASSVPFVKPQFHTDDGEPAASYQLFTYDAGTTTKRTTYADADLATPNANPIVLDAAGRASVFLTPQNWKFVLAPPDDSDPPVDPVWTVDDVPAYSILESTFDIAMVAGENLAANDLVYLSDGSGGATAGRWYKADADQTYSSSGASVVGVAVAATATGVSGTVRRTGRVLGMSGLTTGATYYASSTAGAITTTAPANALVVGRAESSTVLVLDASFGDAVATSRGYMGSAAQTIAGLKSFTSQAETYAGAATTLPAKIAGVFSTDVVEHSFGPVGAGTVVDVPMSTLSIPANMLNANGKSVRLYWGTSTPVAGTGGVNSRLEVAGNSVILRAIADDDVTWWARVKITRIDSDSLDVSHVVSHSGASGGDGKPTVYRQDGLDFTAAIAVKTALDVGIDTAAGQTFLVAEAVG